MSRFDSRRWVIITLASHSDAELQEMIADSIQTSEATLRKTLDGTKAILKFDGRKPTVFNGMTTYNHSQILTELAKPEWTSDD